MTNSGRRPARCQVLTMSTKVEIIFGQALGGALEHQLRAVELRSQIIHILTAEARSQDQCYKIKDLGVRKTMPTITDIPAYAHTGNGTTIEGSQGHWWKPQPNKIAIEHWRFIAPSLIRTHNVIEQVSNAIEEVRTKAARRHARIRRSRREHR